MRYCFVALAAFGACACLEGHPQQLSIEQEGGSVIPEMYMAQGGILAAARGSPLAAAYDATVERWTPHDWLVPFGWRRLPHDRARLRN